LKFRISTHTLSSTVLVADSCCHIKNKTNMQINSLWNKNNEVPYAQINWLKNLFIRLKFISPLYDLITRGYFQTCNNITSYHVI
jgi:hypothetical protein